MMRRVLCGRSSLRALAAGTCPLPSQRTTLLQQRNLWNINEPHPDIVVESEEARQEMKDIQAKMLQNYQVKTIFESRRMKYYIDGDDSEFKDHCRSMLEDIFRPLATTGPLSRDSLVALMRQIGKKKLFSLAQARSTPRRFLSFVEVLATFNVPAAILAANHILAAQMCSAFMSQDAVLRELAGCEDFSRLGSVIMSGGASPEQGVPLKVTALPTRRMLRLDGTTAVLCVGGGISDFVVLRAAIGTKFQRLDDQLFLVKLRDSNGALLPGVDLVEPMTGEAIGLATINFSGVDVDPTCIVSDTTVDISGKITLGADREMWINTMNLQHALLACSVLAGAAKRTLHDITHITTQKMVRGPKGIEEYPFMGVQRNQTAISPLVCRCITYCAALDKLQKAATDTTRNPTLETIALLLLMQHELYELATAAAKAHGDNTGLLNAMTGHHLPHPNLLGLMINAQSTRMLVFQAGSLIVKQKLGPHGGWHAFIARLPPGIMRRFFANPLFSSTSRNIHRHHTFFSHKHAVMQQRASRHKINDRSVMEDGDKWFNWHSLRHHDVENLGESFFEVFMVDCAIAEMAKNLSPETNAQINMITLTCSVAHMHRRSALYVKEYMVASRALSTLSFHHDNLSNLMASRLTPIIAEFGIPPSCTPFNDSWQTLLRLKERPPQVPEPKGPKTKAEDDYVPESDDH